MTVWKCPLCGNYVMKLDENDERLVCVSDDCNFHLDIWEEGPKNIFEVLSALEHEQWMAWAKNILETETISPKRRERWEKLFIPYDQLEESMKEHDREWVRKVMEAITQ
jgi:endogenous inhibitor of DNA gyrase (YacG/DUF329 family)